ncbi:MAG: methyltransferase [Bacteroidetes bacterium]|nr:MAG: methyltransferase [Bacteroidota bacterium]
MTSNIKLIKTEDGSHSLYVKELDETYHSNHGAIQESNHIFIKAGFDYVLSNHPNLPHINILEFGFGTGLNALLTAKRSSNEGKVIYETLEKYPLPQDITQELNYGKILGDETLFEKILSAEWEDAIEISASFLLKKIKVDFRDFSSSPKYHLIYFDAFAPNKQPNLWAKPIFEKCYDLLIPGGAMVTYSAKGQFKRDLKAIGFEVESLPGPPGKFEITRAIKG